MPRTVEEVDHELRQLADTRSRCRAELRKSNLGKDTIGNLCARIDVANSRIEVLLDERSQILLLAQLSAL